MLHEGSSLGHFFACHHEAYRESGGCVCIRNCVAIAEFGMDTGQPLMISKGM